MISMCVVYMACFFANFFATFLAAFFANFFGPAFWRTFLSMQYKSHYYCSILSELNTFKERKTTKSSIFLIR